MASQKLHIDFNCSQRIAHFGPGETAFCKHCQTKVQDLTLLPITEIKNLIRSNQGSLCGRVYEDQLEEGGKRRRLKLLTTGLAGFLLLATNRLAAQSRDTVKTEQHISNTSTTLSKQSPATACADTVSVLADAGYQQYKKHPSRVQFMRIGRRRFYIGWRFPFFTSRKYLMGKFRY
jgi:hypothetical protein